MFILVVVVIIAVIIVTAFAVQVVALVEVVNST